METQTININLIDPNPYQPRAAGAGRADNITDLAASIVQDGLLQPPLARPVDGGRFQLAFGHRRLAAFVFLGRDTIQLFIDDLGNESMFRYAVAENSQRVNINAIEEARAMLRAVQEFEYNSDRVGQLFGVSGSTVRGKLRLLNLPDDTRGLVESGAVSEVAARKLLTLAQAAPDRVLRVAEEIIENPAEKPEYLVSKALAGLSNSVTLWENWRDSEEDPTACGLWSLKAGRGEFPQSLLKEMTAKQAAKAAGLGEVDSGVYDSLLYDSSDRTADKLVNDGASPDEVKRLQHIIDPPACTACDFYLRSNRNHYCVLKACYKRKEAAYLQQLLQDAVESFALPVYDSKIDGRLVYVLGDLYSRSGQDALIWDERKKRGDIRLRSKSSPYHAHRFTKSKYVQAVVVGEIAKDIKKANKNTGFDQKAQSEAWELKRRRLLVVHFFVWEIASERFAGALGGVHAALLEIIKDTLNPFLPGDESASDHDSREWSQRCTIYDLLMNALNQSDTTDQAKESSTPSQIVATYLRGLATTLGVELGDNWQQLAKEFDSTHAESVAAATKKGKQ